MSVPSFDGLGSTDGPAATPAAAGGPRVAGTGGGRHRRVVAVAIAGTERARDPVPARHRRATRPRRRAGARLPRRAWAVPRRGRRGRRVLRRLRLPHHVAPPGRAPGGRVHHAAPVLGRRARRLLPAASLVIVATVVAAVLILDPLTADDVARDAV